MARKSKTISSFLATEDMRASARSGGLERESTIEEVGNGEE